LNPNAYELVLDLPKLRELGLTPIDVAQQAYYALTGGLASEFYRLASVRQATIRIRLDESQRRHLGDLQNLFITTPDGRQVPLSHIAEIRPKPIPTVIEHDNLRRVIGITGFYRPGKLPSMDLAMEIEARAFQQLNFPPGYSIEMRGDMTQMMDSFRRLLYSLLLAVVFMYLVPRRPVPQFPRTVPNGSLVAVGVDGRVLWLVVDEDAFFVGVHHGGHRPQRHGHHDGNFAP
jgi:HAE1 family hydrophobic/amphiphilic exporter-1